MRLLYDPGVLAKEVTIEALRLWRKGTRKAERMELGFCIKRKCDASAGTDNRGGIVLRREDRFLKVSHLAPQVQISESHHVAGASISFGARLATTSATPR
jgi:hypothetical protein